MLAPTTVLQAMDERLGVWPVSGPTLEIGTQAYRDLTWQQQTRRRLLAARRELDGLLRGCNIELVGGTDLFCLIRVADAESCWLALAERGIYVRRFEWSDQLLRLGLPETQQAMRRLQDAFDDIGSVGPISP